MHASRLLVLNSSTNTHTHNYIHTKALPSAKAKRLYAVWSLRYRYMYNACFPGNRRRARIPQPPACLPLRLYSAWEKGRDAHIQHTRKNVLKQNVGILLSLGKMAKALRKSTKKRAAHQSKVRRERASSISVPVCRICVLFYIYVY